MGFYVLGVIIAFIVTLVVITIYVRNKMSTEDDDIFLFVFPVAAVVIAIASAFSWITIAVLSIIAITTKVSDYYKNKKDTK